MIYEMGIGILNGNLIMDGNWNMKWEFKYEMRIRIRNGILEC